MKKLLSVFMSLALILCALSVPCAVAEQAPAAGSADFSFAEIAGLPFEYSSGVGAWSCNITINEDGSFTGSFHDSDMGDIGEGYPNGTVFQCDFHGVLTLTGPGAEPCTWMVTVTELALDDGQVVGEKTIEDGIQFVTAEPVGLVLGHTMTLYTRGADLSIIPEDAAFWFHLNAFELQDGDTLPVYGLYDAENESGFVGIPLR